MLCFHLPVFLLFIFIFNIESLNLLYNNNYDSYYKIIIIIIIIDL